MEHRLFNIFVENDYGTVWALYAKSVKILKSLLEKLHTKDSFLLDGYKVEVSQISAFKVFSIEPSMIHESWHTLNSKQLEHTINLYAGAHFKNNELHCMEKMGYDVTEEFQAQDWEFFEAQISIAANSPFLVDNNDNKSMKTIFISHASKDREIVDCFVDEYLERGLNIDSHSQVYYTSSQVTGIAAGSDWRKDIQQGVIGAQVVFCFISQYYAQSQYCIAELGAAWAFEKTIIPILIPPHVDVKGGELFAALQMIKGADRLALGRLRDDLVDNHKIGERISSSPKWDKALSKFVEAVTLAEGKK